MIKYTCLENGNLSISVVIGVLRASMVTTFILVAVVHCDGSFSPDIFTCVAFSFLGPSVLSDEACHVRWSRRPNAHSPVIYAHWVAFKVTSID